MGPGCLQADLDHAIEVSSQFRRQLDSSTARCAVLDAELAGARLAVSAQQKNAEVAHTDRQALARKVADLAHCEVDLSIAQKEMTLLRAEAGSLRSQSASKSKVDRLLACKESEASQLQTELTQLRSEMDSIRSELAEAKRLNRQLALKESRRANLQTELNQLGSELTSMRSNNQSMLSRHTRQAAELTQLKTELSHTRAEVAQLRSELDQAQAETTQKKKELSQLHPELESLRQQSQQWAAQTHAQSESQTLLTQKEAELSQLQAELTQLQADLDNVHQHLPCESLPSKPPNGSEVAQHSCSQSQLHLDDSTASKLQQEASWQSAADQKPSRSASPAPLAESASVSSVTASCKHSEAMSEGELRKMAEAFRKSLRLEVNLFGLILHKISYSAVLTGPL